MGQLKFSGKNIEEAKRNAAEELGVSESELLIEKVEQEGGFLFGKKVAITVRAEAFSKGDEVSFIKGLLKAARIPGEVSRREEEDRIILEIKSEDGGLLIGKGGQGLEAIQHLIGKAAKRRRWSEKPILVDVENYRNKRVEKLKSRAVDLAGRAKSEGRPLTTEPLNAYERRAVHLALQGVSGINSKSLGDGPLRRVCIVPAETEDDARGNRALPISTDDNGA